MRLRVTKFVPLFAFLTMLSFAVQSPGAVNIPEWMHQAAAQTLPTYPADTSAVVLLDDTTYTVNGPGDVTEHCRRVVKILRPEGRKETGLYVNFRKDEKLTYIHAWSIDTSGREYEVKDKEFAESSSFNESLYDDVRARVASAPAAGPGTVVGFEYDIQRRFFFDELHWLFQDDIPVHLAILTVQFPSGYEYKDLWANAEPAKASPVGPNRWQWTKSDIAAIEKEDHRPSLFALAGRMQLNYFGGNSRNNTQTWDALGRWYNGLTADRLVSTPEITDKVHQLVAGKTDFDGKARAVSDFMQAEIRYVSIDIGIGGFQPHPAGDVFRYRYGDCKDKATLMSTMLREAGIASDLVVIHTLRGVARQEIPSSLFNHVILAIEVPAGADVSKYRSLFTTSSGQRLLLFDPTDPYTPLGEIAAQSQDRYALLVTPKGGEVIHTPTLDPSINQLVRRGTFTITAQGGISGNVTEARSGEPASDWRGLFQSTNEQDRTKTIEASVSHSLSTASLKNVKLEALDQRTADLVTSYDISSDRYAQVTGPLMLVRPRVLGRLAIGLDKKPRRYPIEMPSTTRDDDEYTIEIPAGYTIDDMPEPMKAESSFASYESHCEKQGSKIVYKRTYINRAMEIGTDKIAEFRAFQNHIAEDENAVVVLKKVN